VVEYSKWQIKWQTWPDYTPKDRDVEKSFDDVYDKRVIDDDIGKENYKEELWGLHETVVGVGDFLTNLEKKQIGKVKSVEINLEKVNTKGKLDELEYATKKWKEQIHKSEKHTSKTIASFSSEHKAGIQMSVDEVDKLIDNEDQSRIANWLRIPLKILKRLELKNKIQK